MPLQENPNLANRQTSIAVIPRSLSPAKTSTQGISLLNVMKTKSRALINVPADLVRPRPQDPEATTEPPQLSIENVESSMNMSQVNGLFRDQSPQEPSRNSHNRIVSPSILRSALAFPEPSPTPEPAWSSAVGHASTGKSGRVIERLQGDIDRLHREKQLLKVQFEEVEKTNETLVTRTQYLQDRNSNYEHSHETNLLQLERKERLIQDLREELKRAKEKTTRAEEAANIAADKEGTWKDHANQAKARASQKEAEYDTIVACRNTDNGRYQGGLDKIKTNVNELIRQREEDVEKQKKLEIIAEQQKQTIEQLEELTKRLNANFKAYRTEIDRAIAELRKTTSGHDVNMLHKLEEMTRTTGEMRWVMNVEREVNHKNIPPIAQRDVHSRDSSHPPDTPTSPAGRNRLSIDMKGKQGRKKLAKSMK